MKFESKEEEYVFWYFMELAEHGFVTDIDYQPKSILLSSTKRYEEKRPKSVKKFSLLQAHEYTADFKITWDRKAHHIFFEILGKPIESRVPFFFAEQCEITYKVSSLIEVKGTFDMNKSVREFAINQKWLYDRYRIYAQKVVPVPNAKGKPVGALFLKTFTPQKYLLRKHKKTGRPLKINYKPRTLNEYLKQF